MKKTSGARRYLDNKIVVGFLFPDGLVLYKVNVFGRIFP